ncbi:hypothetical protein IPdc08_01035 [archaeon]|nr:hypothetical protein IPdc08_01035 [archaeon]
MAFIEKLGRKKISILGFLGITTFPYIKHVLGLRTSLLFFRTFALIGLLVTITLGKETKGKTLEGLTEFKTQAESKELSIDHA